MERVYRDSLFLKPTKYVLLDDPLSAVVSLRLAFFPNVSVLM